MEGGVDDIAAIRVHLRNIEREGRLLSELRAYSKTDGGRLNDTGRGFIAFAQAYGLRQSFVAKLLDISASAVSQHYNR
jgi:hypothetical protein